MKHLFKVYAFFVLLPSLAIAQDFGSPPKNYEAKIKNHMETKLKDFDSAKFKNFTKPKKDVNENHVKKTKAYGYSSCVEINAKNSYGGYIGFHIFHFFFVNGEIVDSTDLTEVYTKLGFGDKAAVGCESKYE